MAEFRLDIIANTENLNQGLQNLQAGLSEVSAEAKKAGKDTQDAFNQTGGAEKFQKSLKDQVMTLVKFEQEIKKLRSEIKTTFDPTQVGVLQKQLDNTTKSLINFETELGKTETVSKSLKAQLRENKEILSQLEDQGLETTDTFTQLAIETGRLQDQINDTNERIKFFASDTRGLDGLIGVTKLATAGFAVGQGAAALFGAENENVQKALLKVNAAMAILNGLQEIQNALQKSSAAYITIETALRKIKIFFLGQEAIATTGVTAAQKIGIITAKAFRVALIATGIGAFVALLIYAASKMGAFGDSTEETTKKIQDQKDALEKHNEELRKEIDNITEIDRAKKGGINDLTRELELLKARGATAEEVFLKEQQIRDKERAELNKRLGFLTNDAQSQSELQEALKNNANESEAAQTAFLRAEGEKRTKLSEDEYNKRKSIIDANNANRIDAMQDGFDKDIAQLEENQRKGKESAIKQGLNMTLLTAKFAKERTDLILRYEQIRLNNQKEIDDFLNANMKNQFDIEKEETDKIIKNKIDFLDSLEEIKQLELDIEFESGDKSIKETIRIAEEKLKVEIDFAEKRLEVLKALGGDESQIKAIELAIQKGKNALDQLAKEGSNAKFLEAIGLGDITEEDLANIKDATATAVNSIKSIFDDLLSDAIDNNRSLIDSLTSQIDEVRGNIDTQRALQQEGRANELQAEEQKLAALEAQRQAAFEREKQLAKQKLNLDTVQQVSSLITASSNIFKALSPLGPVGTAIAVATIAAMFAQFTVAQVRARQSINQQTFKKGGEIKGKRHNADGWGGEKFSSENGDVYIEDGEYVVNRNSTKKYKALIDAINNDNLAALQNMLSGTGVSLNDEKVEGYKKLKSDYSNNELKHRIELENKLGNKEISDFKKLYEKNANKPKDSITYANGYKIEQRGNRTIKTKL